MKAIYSILNASVFMKKKLITKTVVDFNDCVLGIQLLVLSIFVGRIYNVYIFLFYSQLELILLSTHNPKS